MAYWALTDIFSERGTPEETKAPPFSGGFGLLTLQGIRKPTFFAYKFLAALGPLDLATEDSDPTTQSWATATPGTHSGVRPAVQALFWDYTPQAPPKGQIDQTFYNKEIPAPPIAPTDLTIQHLPNGRYTLKVFRVGHTQNDPYTAYLRLGSPATLTPAQLRAVQSHATGHSAENHNLTIKTTHCTSNFRPI